jgi:hypothetical protein
MSSPLQNQRYETFAQNVVAGKHVADAYQAAGFKTKPQAAHTSGLRLLKDERVEKRVGELRARGAQKAAWTLAQMIVDLNDVFTKAVARGQLSAAVAAIREAAVLSGFRIERQETGDAGAFAKLSESELDDLILIEYSRLQALPIEHDAVSCQESDQAIDSAQSFSSSD